MDKMFLDALVEYPAKIIQAIGKDVMIMSLLADNPKIDIESEEADDIFDKSLFDYGYVDNTTAEAGAYICVEAEVPNVSTRTIQDYRLYVSIICHKEFMKLNVNKFLGTLGNRRDNLVRRVDNIISGTSLLGIGFLTLESLKTISSPPGFSARELTYSISDFKGKRT